MNGFITFAFIITIIGFPLNLYAQKQVERKPKVHKSSNTNAKKEKSKLISLGVVNNRALNLVKPDYPRAAIAMKLSGTVKVEVIIDQAGYVIEANAVSGHPLLRKPSMQAANNSKFAPYFLNNNSVKIRGLIVYNFIPNTQNWLELGYHSVETERLINFLPKNFDDEKKLILKMNSTETPYDPNGYINLVSSIENKLRNDEKSLWLFQLGTNLRKLLDNRWDKKDELNIVTNIQTSLYFKPQNVSPNLILKLENLVKFHQENKKLFNEEFERIYNKFYILGM